MPAKNAIPLDPLATILKGKTPMARALALIHAMTGSALDANRQGQSAVRSWARRMDKEANQYARATVTGSGVGSPAAVAKKTKPPAKAKRAVAKRKPTIAKRTRKPKVAAVGGTGNETPPAAVA